MHGGKSLARPRYGVGNSSLKTAASAITLESQCQYLRTRGISIVAPKWLAKIQNALEMCKREKRRVGTGWQSRVPGEMFVSIADLSNRYGC
jgi:hypothetical protein